MNNFYTKRGKNRYNFFVHPHTLSNVKKKEQMEKAVKLIHKFMLYDIMKKFMNYDFMGDIPIE